MVDNQNEKPFEKLRKAKKGPSKYSLLSIYSLLSGKEKPSDNKDTVSNEIMIDEVELESKVESEIEFLCSAFTKCELYGWEDKSDLALKILNSSAFKTIIRAYFEIDGNQPQEKPSNAHKKTFHLLNRLNPNYQISADFIKGHVAMEKSGALDEAIEHLQKAAEILECIHYPFDGRGSDFDFDKLKDHLDHPPCGIDNALLGHPIALRHRIELKLPVDMGTEEGVTTLFMYGLLGKSIERIARGVEITFKEGIFSRAQSYYESLGYSADNVGYRGAASDNESATRGLFIRELNDLVPERVQKRFAVIAELARLGGHENVDRHLVRSILMQGHT